MPFCLGSHLTFSLPFGGVGAPERLDPRVGGRNLLLSDEGFLTSGRRPLIGPARRCARAAPGRHGLADFPPGLLGRLRGASGLGVRVSQAVASDPGSLRFILYADPARAFFCPEPWHGEPTRSTSVAPGPGERFDWEMTTVV